MSHLIGIDLGTTNSCVSTIIDGTPHIIPSKEGERTIPSVVSIDSFGNRLVGKAAKNQAITNPKGTIFSIKRLMGTNKKININNMFIYYKNIHHTIIILYGVYYYP